MIVYYSSITALFVLCYKHKSFLEPFGFTYQSNTLYLFVFYTLVKALDPLDKILLNWLSRMHEYSADRFAVNHGHSENLKSALIAMNKSSKRVIKFHTFYV